MLNYDNKKEIIISLSNENSTITGAVTTINILVFDICIELDSSRNFHKIPVSRWSKFLLGDLDSILPDLDLWFNPPTVKCVCPEAWIEHYTSKYYTINNLDLLGAREFIIKIIDTYPYIKLRENILNYIDLIFNNWLEQK